MIHLPDPPLGAGRVRLRSWDASDIGMLIRAAQDVQVRRGSSLRSEDMPASAERWVAKREALRLDGSGLSLAIEDYARAGQAIGCAALNAIDAPRRHASIGCWLVESERRRGIGPVAVALLCNWGFERLRLDEIVALVEPTNDRSKVMLSSLGFSNEGLQLRAHRIEGVLHDMCLYKRRRTEGEVLLPHRCAAVVLAAGRGTRMGGATPKPLRLISGRTMLDRVIDTAAAATGRPCVVVAPGERSVIAGHARQRGCETVVQARPAGTAHALLSALEATDVDEQTDMVVVLTADAPLLRPDSVRRIINACAARKGSLGAMLSFTPSCSRGYGRLVRGPDGRLARLTKPEAPYGPAESGTGAYCLKTVGLRERLRHIPALRGEHHLGLVADAHEAGLDVVHLDDPDEGLGANTEEELAHLEAICEARDLFGLRRCGHDEEA